MKFFHMNFKNITIRSEKLKKSCKYCDVKIESQYLAKAQSNNASQCLAKISCIIHKIVSVTKIDDKMDFFFKLGVGSFSML